jgi:hypothetical protein
MPFLRSHLASLSVALTATFLMTTSACGGSGNDPGASEGEDETSASSSSSGDGDGDTGGQMDGDLYFMPPGGIFTSGIEVEISSVQAGAIHYTVDGSLPDANSPTYEGPVAISSTTQLRAVLYPEGAEEERAGAPYIFASDDLEVSTNLPIVVIESWGNLEAINDEERPRDHHLVHSVFIEPGDDGLASFTTAPSYAGRGGMHIRGNSTTEYPKKQWNLELWKQDDDGKNVPLLGLPKESDWVLQAPYSDKSLMRNYLMYTWSNRIGRYAANTKFVEIWVDDDGTLDPGDYVGVYEFMEKVKVDPNRVSVTKLTPEDNALPEVSGGYLLQRDWIGEPGEDWLTTDTYEDELLFKSPKPDLITEPQREYITGFLNEFEMALSGSGFSDPASGYAAYIDVDSFIDHHLLVELGRNVDGYVLSTYMHKDREGLLNMGPIWDYNGALGNADYFDCDQPEGWHYQNDEFPADNPNGYRWYARLFEDPAFQTRYQDRWNELRAGPLANESLIADIDEAAALLQAAGATDRNFARWPVLGEQVWPNDPGAVDRMSYGEEIAYLQSWLVARLAWMDSQL